MAWISTLVFLWIFTFLVAGGKYPRTYPETPDFDEKFYSGSRGQAIAAIYYKRSIPGFAKQPKMCYGFFADFTKVVTACSCLAYSASPEATSTPWLHIFYYTIQLDKVYPEDLKVGVILDEFLKTGNNQPVNLVDVATVQLARRCYGDYKYNYGFLKLKAAPKGIKLAWLYTAEWLMMRMTIHKVVMAIAAGTGRCEVMRWIDHGKPLEKNGQSRVEAKGLPPLDSKIRIDSRGHMRELITNTIELSSMTTCLDQICPEYAPLDYRGFKRQDPSECFDRSKYNVTRYCATWRQMDSLCYVPEGTPVFCEVGHIRGVMGILSNRTLWCDKSFNFKNVFFGVDIGMFGFHKGLRIRNGPKYNEYLPEYFNTFSGGGATYELQ